MPAWNELLRQARDGTGLTRRELADLSGISEETIFSYEAGRRNPTRERLLPLLRALNLDGQTTNTILAGAGMDPDPSPWLRQGRLHLKPMSELQGDLDSYRWPCLALNERFEILAWNRAAVVVAEIDFGKALPAPYQRNLLRIATMTHFRHRVRNWRDVVSTMVGMYKNHHMDNEELDAGSPYFRTILADIYRRDEHLLSALTDLWERTPPRPQVTRNVFPVAWQTGDGTPLDFNCLITDWDEFGGVAANDWHPANAATWAWLEIALARR